MHLFRPVKRKDNGLAFYGCVKNTMTRSNMGGEVSAVRFVLFFILQLIVHHGRKSGQQLKAGI